ncbi:hypothetical protein [Streptomyces ossamyceticus]|uniref:Leucine rich repeat (LRR) protein n=1 Tax=Streptomyces ossamyceticus TaxID=249581 RepID=A0ABV2VBS1_9ACTN
MLELIVGDLDPAALRAVLLPGRVRALAVRDNLILRSLDFLRGLDRLTHLDIDGTGALVDDLTPLTELPLTWPALNSLPGLESPRALHVLSASPTLGALDLGIPLCADSVDEALPTGLPPEYLRFTRSALKHTALRGLGQLRSVKTLSLAKLLERLTADDFGEIVRMPALENLRVNRNAVGWLVL